MSHHNLTDKTDSDKILSDNNAILAIKTEENNEPMVDIKDQHEIVIGPSPEIPNNTDYTKMRKSVFEKLKQAQALLPQGLRFCLYEGYRSLALQKMLFDNRYNKLKTLYPSWTADDIFLETTKLISAVVNQDGTKNIPPHSTGGAIDVYLIDQDGNTIDMGIHPKDWMEDNDGSLSLTASVKVSNEAQKYRKIMCNALIPVGFINYPTEYWHWSYGDRRWAYYKNMPFAIYDSI